MEESKGLGHTPPEKVASQQRPEGGEGEILEENSRQGTQRGPQGMPGVLRGD